MRFHVISLDISNSRRPDLPLSSNGIGDAVGALTTRYVAAADEDTARSKAMRLALADIAAQGFPQFDTASIVSIAPCGLLTFLLRQPGKGFTFYMER